MVEWEDETIRPGKVICLRFGIEGWRHRIAVSPWVISKTSIREPEKELAVASEYEVPCFVGVKPGMEIGREDRSRRSMSGCCVITS